MGSGGHKQPPLLRTCRQGREEAAPIFYSKLFCLDTYTLRTILPQACHWIRAKAPRLNVFIIHSIDPRYSLIKPWLELCHQCEIERLKIVDDEEETNKSLESLFSIAIELRGQPWPMVERVLKHTIECVRAANEDDFVFGDEDRSDSSVTDSDG